MYGAPGTVDYGMTDDEYAQQKGLLGESTDCLRRLN